MAEESDTERYEVAVIGGGPAGQMAAMYSTRLGHRTAADDCDLVALRIALLCHALVS